jgi:pimeloyl-ACP methyl ester carboxylesterase
MAILAFIPAWLTALGTGSSFLKFVTPLICPFSETDQIIGIWYVIGLVVLGYLYARHPQRLPEMKRVFADGGRSSETRRPDPGLQAGQETPHHLPATATSCWPFTVTGRYDECTPGHLAEMHRRIAGSQLVIIEDASHLCLSEQPAEFTKP